MLRLDVEFMLGVYFGTSGPESTQPDWPPEPDRVFSALVAAWAARGKRVEETEALEWLEMQAAPSILSSVCAVRDAPTAYVPPNDISGKSLEALPTYRRRQERRFPAAIPGDPQVTYVWRHATPAAPIREALCLLARDTSRVGRAASLTRCHFCESEPNEGGRKRATARRWVYPGRLAELERAHGDGRRPALGASVQPVVSLSVKRARSCFGHHWHIFADVGRTSLDVRAGAIAAYAFRSALLSGFQGRRAPEFISGKDDDGYPSRSHHLAILPMSNVGWDRSDGSLMGLALCLPREASKEDGRVLVNALKNLMNRQWSQNPDARAEIAVGLPGRENLYLSRQPQPRAESLKPQRYTRSAMAWATATPIVLDWALQADDPYLHSSRLGRQEEISECITQACTHIGLPRPVHVEPVPHSAVRGSPPVVPPQTKPTWAHWGIPPAVKRKQLTHAMLVFDEPVQGPIVLGAGRFYGLGLCLPLGGGI